MPGKAFLGGTLLYRSLTMMLAALSVLSAHAADLPKSPVPKALFLHYRWNKDGSLTLVSQKTVEARLKPSRSEAHRRSRGTAPSVDPSQVPGGLRNPSLRTALGGGPVALSYAVISAVGDTLHEATLPDPRIRRVEYTDKGKPGLRSHTVVADSGDIFLRVAEPEARALKFFRWRHLAPAGLAKSAAGGPSAPEAVKIPLAEFALP
jgi:hypothetical protein